MDAASPRQQRDGHAARNRWVERAAFAAAVAFLGLLLAMSAQTDVPAGDRVGRRLELLELIAEQQRRTAGLQAEAAALEAQVASYQDAAADDRGVPAQLQEQLDVLAVEAGLTALQGPGLTVTLRDSELSLSDAESVDVNDLVIHEQDLQAVVNALWAGGAEAMSINGQRVLTTSAVRCVGNILLLNGRVHPPPYVISAIGDQRDLQNALDRDGAVAAFREAASRFDLGYEVVAEPDVSIPAFVGSPDVTVAEPVVAADPL